LKLLVKENKRRAVSPVIATLLLIAIAVAAAIIVYAFVTGLIGGLTTGSSSNLVAATASITVPSGSGPGTLVVSITNNANSPITGIQVVFLNQLTDSAFAAVTCMGQLPAGLGAPCGGYAGPDVACGLQNAGSATTPVPICNTVGAIATANPIPVGSGVSGSESVKGVAGAALQSGTTYSMTLTINFANGGTHTEALSATAQL